VEAHDEPAFCSGAILAGGESRRFGQDRARVILTGKPLVPHVPKALKALFSEVSIVTDDPVSYERHDVTAVSDIVRGFGSPGGLLTALVHAKEDRCFVAACDMPILNTALIRRMPGTCRGHDVVVPDVRGEVRPLHAFCPKRCIHHIRERVAAAGGFHVFDFYSEVLTLRLREGFREDVDPKDRRFTNVGTPEELLRAERWIEGSETKNDDGCK
jgi:FdhD protein